MDLGASRQGEDGSVAEGDPAGGTHDVSTQVQGVAIQVNQQVAGQGSARLDGHALVKHQLTLDVAAEGGCNESFLELGWRHNVGLVIQYGRQVQLRRDDSVDQGIGDGRIRDDLLCSPGLNRELIKGVVPVDDDLVGVVVNLGGRGVDAASCRRFHKGNVRLRPGGRDGPSDHDGIHDGQAGRLVGKFANQLIHASNLRGFRVPGDEPCIQDRFGAAWIG